MTEKKRTIADGVALIALCIVTASVSISLAAFTDMDVVPRWVLSVVAGIICAAAAFAITSNLRQPRK